MFTILSNVGRRGAVCLCSVCKSEYAVKDRFMSRDVHAGDQCNDCKNLPLNPPTKALLHQVYDYDPLTGRLVYKKDFHRRHKGEEATSTASNGYLVVTLDKTYLAHRIIWLMQTGSMPEFIDHENHIRSDNRWTNLRDVNQQRNAVNKSLNTNNKTGYLGVSYMKTKNKYRASITIDRKHIHLGLFNRPEQAYIARQNAEQQHNFHKNHGK